MSEDAKSAERQRLAAALRENLRRRKMAPRSTRIDATNEPPMSPTASPAPAMAEPAMTDGESKG